MPSEPLSTREPDRRRRGAAWKTNRREGLLDAATRAVLHKGPGVSMDDVATEAGVSRVIFYRYFEDKSGLYAALAERYVDALMERLRAALSGTTDPEMRLRRTIESYVRFIEENRDMYDFLMHRAIKEGPGAQVKVADFMRSVASEVGDILNSEIKAFGFDPEPAGVWANGVVGMVQLASDWWLETHEFPRSRLVDYLVGLLSQGFFGLAADGGTAARWGLRPLNEDG